MGVKFNKTGVIEASGETINNNLLLNSDFHARYQQTTGWNTEKNGTTLANSWGGYNSGVANQATCYHAHLVEFDGRWCYVYIRDTETWLGVSQGGLQARDIAPNTTYTFSISQYRTTGSNNYITSGLYYRKVGSTSYAFHSGCPQIVTDLTYNKWIRGTFTFTTPSDIDTSVNISWYIYGHVGGTGTIYMCDPKLEIGSVATSPCLASSEGHVELQHGFIERSTPPLCKHIFGLYRNLGIHRVLKNTSERGCFN